MCGVAPRFRKEATRALHSFCMQVMSICISLSSMGAGQGDRDPCLHSFLKGDTRSMKRVLSCFLACALASTALAPAALAATADPGSEQFTPTTTSDAKVAGFNNEAASLKMQLAGRYNSGAQSADGGSLEIVQYNAANGYSYAVSGVKGKLIAVQTSQKMDAETVSNLAGTEYDLKDLLTSDSFTYGDMTSVAVSPDGSKLAVAVQAENYAAAGLVALFACNADGSLNLLSTAQVGVQPDMVTFAGESAILTADEGEPRLGTEGTDPKGSVSVVKIGQDNALSVTSVYFDQCDAQRDQLTESGVLIQKGIMPSTDFEPEYIAVSGNNAYVSLQEANSIAVLNIADETFTGVYPLGFQDFGTTNADLEKDGVCELKNYEGIYGIKMSDGISATAINGKTYLLTANEGDSRADWSGMSNEYESKTSPTGNVTFSKKVVWFNSEMWDGLDTTKDYMFGGRSISMYEVTDSGLNLVYDSGSTMEETTLATLPANFNCSNDKLDADNRSGKKGPEPETVVTGTVNGKTYAFAALERIGGVMVYDITDPSNVSYVNYINSREFDSAIQDDVSPEGLCFVPAESNASGKAQLLAACEVSGTLAVYELEDPNAPEVVAPTTSTAPKAGTVVKIISGKSAGASVQVVKSADKNGKGGVVSYAACPKNTSYAYVPSAVKIKGATYKVTSIKSSACENNKKLTKVTIPSTVTTIGKYAFRGCSKLKTVTLPSSLKTIERSAFSKCTSLTKLTIPTNVTKIGENALYHTGVKTLVVKSGKLTKSSVSGSLKSSSVTKVVVAKSKVKTYSKYFTKSNCGKTVKVVGA